MKAKVTIKGTPVELEGDAIEVLQVIRSLGKGSTPPRPAVTAVSTTTTGTLGAAYTIPPIYEKIPSAKELVDYIEATGGPDLNHSMRDLAMHFLGQHIEAKKDPRLFGRFFGHLQTAQRRLQIKHHRKFEHILRPISNGNGRILTITTYRLKHKPKSATLPHEEGTAPPWEEPKEITVSR